MRMKLEEINTAYSLHHSIMYVCWADAIKHKGMHYIYIYIEREREREREGGEREKERERERERGIEGERERETEMKHTAEWRIYTRTLTIISSDNDLLPGLRQTIIWTNTGILLIGPLRTIVSEILIQNHSGKYVWKCRLRNCGHSVPASICWWAMACNGPAEYTIFFINQAS